MLVVMQETRVFYHISSSKKRVENATHSRVFLVNVETFNIVMKHSASCLVQSIL